MAQDLFKLSNTEVERIYERSIRPDLLDDIPTSKTPTAVLVGGQPGAGKTVALAQVRAQLANTVGPAATISGDEVREYHPYWRSHARIDARAAELTQADAGLWYTRLTNDGITKGANLVFETSMRQPDAVLQLADRLHASGYRVDAVILAVERDLSRQATLTRYDVARTVGDVPRFVPGPYHDSAYDRLRTTVTRLEKENAIDQIQLITRDGRQLYNNQLSQGQWAKEAKAAFALDDFRERSLPARELADTALRWQTLVQRLANDASVPREVAAQVVAWRNESVLKAQRDPDAKKLMQWGLEAEAFKTMSRQQFVREFPHHAKLAERLQEAFVYAENNFAHEVDRERFVAQARNRIADRIAEGRFASTDKVQEKSQKPSGKLRTDRDGPTR